jgi:hypothetical protein
MNEDRGTLGQHGAIVEHERGDLHQRVDANELIASGARLPRRSIDDPVGRLRDLERGLDRRRPRALRAVERQHR